MRRSAKGATGFEPAKALANRFTVCPVCRLRYTPRRKDGLYASTALSNCSFPKVCAVMLTLNAERGLA